MTKDQRQPSRRTFLKGATSGLIGTALSQSAVTIAQEVPPVYQLAQGQQWKAVGPLPENVTRTWIAPDYWANRLQDWRLHQGRIECLTAAEGHEVRTVALLTREMVRGNQAAHLRMRTGTLKNSSQGGFSGFLIGAGAGNLDYRAAALVQKASGIGGGLMCVYESGGQVHFREHTSEEQPLAFAKLPPSQTAGGSTRRTSQEDVELRLSIVPQSPGTFEVRCSAWNHQNGQFLAGAVRSQVAEDEILGGIALVSSTPTGSEGSTYWFQDVQTAGQKVAVHPERGIGPILGTLHSLNGKMLKLSAQLVPLGEKDPKTVQLQYRTRGGSWRNGPSAKLEPGFTALFKISDWDSSQDWEYRTAYTSDASQPAYYAGTIRKEPGNAKPLTVGLINCTIASARSLEGGVGKPELPQAELLGRYTRQNLYYPHEALVKNAGHHRPDLWVFAGDQLYEGNPTRVDRSESPTLDYLYKWYLWVLSFRELTRDTPAILMTDDHDVYHGNLWGNGGRKAPEGDPNRGGYRCSADFVNLVQRTQCGHNPEPFDPTPVDRGITVYYGAFRYGGVSFAVLEDRKFKTAAIQGEDLDVHEAELLGARQERFLESWSKDWNGVSAKVCLTQSLLACVQTSPQGRPLLDFDANGYPKLGRDRAIRLLREARALVLSGDQHLTTLVRHGLDSFTDAVVQFTGPAAGSSWQRWFDPGRPLPNSTGQPNTGDFTDAFGNKLRVLAVANPKVSFAEYRVHHKGRGQGLGDRRLKSEGYGIVRIDRQKREFVIECWPWNVDPGDANARQYSGWPYRLPFDQCDGRSLPFA